MNGQRAIMGWGGAAANPFLLKEVLKVIYYDYFNNPSFISISGGTVFFLNIN